MARVRQPLFGPTKGKLGLEMWRFKTHGKARYERQCWLMWHGRWHHKYFFRVGSWVYVIAWKWGTGKSHLCQ